MENLLYFDVEYANSKNKRICQIGLMIQNIKTENPTYPELDILVNLDDDFDDMRVNVHYITKSMVLNAEKYSVNVGLF